MNCTVNDAGKELNEKRKKQMKADKKNKLFHKGRLCGLVTNEFYTGKKPKGKNIFDEMGIKQV